MARQARFVLPDVPVHIVHRGIDRMPCFREDEDHLVYLALLRGLVAKAGCAVHAYCLMTNHVHLLVTPARKDSCTRLMHAAAHRYSQYFNRKYQRTGPLWEGRFRSCLVGTMEYLVTCHRYIECNPLRAGMVTDPGKYPWSSYSANAGLHLDPLVTMHEALLSMGRKAYADLVAQEISPEVLQEIRASTAGGYPLASDEMKERLAASAGRRLVRQLPGPKVNAADEKRSGPVPDLFSGGGAS